VAMSGDNRLVLTGGGKKVSLWGGLSGKMLWQVISDPDDRFACMAYSSNGRYVATGGFAQVSIWDSSDGKLLRRIPMDAYTVNTIAFSPDSKLLLTGSNDWTARLWNVESGKELRRFDHQFWIGEAIFSPDGHFVLTAGGAKTISMWDVESGKLLRAFGGDVGAIERAEFTDDGTFLLTAGQNHIDVLWDTMSGKSVQRFTGDIKGPWSVNRTAGGAYSLHSKNGEAAVIADGLQIEKAPAPSKPPVNALVRPGEDVDDPDNFSLEDYEASKKAPRGVTTLDFPSYGEYYLTINADQTVVLMLDRRDNSEVRRFVSRSHVNSMEFSPDGRFVVTGGGDGATRLWSSATGKELAMLVSFEDGNWAVADPDGRFDSSDLDGGVSMHWVVDDDPMRALPLEIFMRDYYTPRLLARIMSGEHFPPVATIGSIKNRVQPEVKIASVVPSKVRAGAADVVVHAVSVTDEAKQASGLQDLRLFRNGQLVANTALDTPLESGDFKFQEIQLPTSAGIATFAAYAFNSERVKSATTQKVYAYKTSGAGKARAWLLQIGINHYRATGCELRGSVPDAEELSRVLSERLEQRGLDVRAVRLVSDGKEDGATKERIREALERISSEATPDDVFFMSFSGHGYGDERGQFYLLPSDIEGNCRKVDRALLKKAISADELAEWLRTIDAGEMTFVLDACQSASSVEANDFKPGPMGSRGLGQLAYDKRMRILAASQGNQAAQESNLLGNDDPGDNRTRGLLSYVLTDEGLEQGQADWKPKDGKITVGEWLAYAADEVPKRLVAGGVQAPRGFLHVAKPVEAVGSPQVPAVFDFSKKDEFVLQ
jgi:WD40 repeat protein/uncharacterized caspase-like protein